MFLSRFFKSCLGSPAGNTSSSGDKYQAAEPQPILSNKRRSISSAKGTQTVVPVDRDIENDKRPLLQDSPIQTSVRQKNVRTIRVAEITSVRSIVDLEKECLSIMEMIKILTPEDRKQKRHPLDDPSRIMRYTIQEPSHGTTGTPKVKQVTSMRKILFRTIMRENARDSKENDLTEMVMVAMDVLDLLERNKAKITTPRKYTSKLPGVAYEWSMEGSLVLLDVLLLTMYDHVSSADVYSVAPLTGTWYKTLEEICARVKAHVISHTRTDPSKVESFQRISDLLFQCVSRAAKLVRMLGVCCLVSKCLTLPTLDHVASLARVLQLLADCITLRQRESEKDASYTVRMLYWGACDALLGLVDQMGSLSNRLIVQDPSNGNGNTNISSNNILEIILSSLAASSPGPMEMCIEINRLQTIKPLSIAMPQPALTPLPGYALAIPDSPGFLTSTPGGLTPSPTALTTNNVNALPSQNNSQAWTGTAATLNLLIIDSSKNMKALSELFNAELLSADSIRLYYLIYGLQRALRADILNTARHRNVHDSAKMTRKLRDQWLTTLADSLLLVLDQDWRSAPYGLSHDEFKKGNGTLSSARGESSLLSSQRGPLSARLSARTSSRGPTSARNLLIAGGGNTPGTNAAPSRGDNKYNLLIVDDSHMNRKMIRKVLVNAGHHCEEAEDGLLSIAKVLEKQTSTTALYDGILMDFVMPNMDGPTATKALRAMGYNGVIIGVTGNQLSADIEHFLECGANKVLMKPLVVDQFRQVHPHNTLSHHRTPQP